jgi:diacylglycerol O-acyltransferase
VLVPLHVEEPRAWVRLEHTSRAASEAKALLAALGADLLLRWSELAPSFALRALWRVVRGSGRAPVDLVVSSVPGPREPLTLGGAALERIYSAGPLLETTGLNLTFWSYAGQLHACVLTCADHPSDPQAIADALIASLAELRRAPPALRRAA